MFKKLFTILLGLFVFAGVAGSAYANTSVRLEQPKSPTGKNDFQLVFTALDTNGSALTVKCFKKGPTDGAFTQFGSDIALSAGGNTDTCQNPSSFVTGNGTYQFYVTVNNGTSDTISSTVTVDYNTSGPGTPTNYSRSNVSSCQNNITFRSADDSGKTVKVVLYRSTNTSFNADPSTQAQSVAIGSNTDHVFTDTVPDCSKTYYYVLRAFDSAGNGSGLVGDSGTTTTTVVVSPTGTQGSGAIPANGTGSSNGSVLGVSKAGTGKEEVLGKSSESGQVSTTPSATNSPEGQSENGSSGGLFSSKKMLLLFGILAMLAAAFFWWWRKRNS